MSPFELSHLSRPVHRGQFWETICHVFLSFSIPAWLVKKWQQAPLEEVKYSSFLFSLSFTYTHCSSFSFSVHPFQIHVFYMYTSCRSLSDRWRRFQAALIQSFVSQMKCEDPFGIMNSSFVVNFFFVWLELPIRRV